MDIRLNGEHALIIDLANLNEVLNLHAQLQALNLPQVRELVPAARTITVHLYPTDQHATIKLVRSLRVSETPVASEAANLVEIPTRYDGPDLSPLAAHLGLSERELVDAHTSMRWRAAFGGFAPGFMYLSPTNSWFDVPRLAEPRAKIPAGAVGLAGGFSGIYPQSSPGGWQLLGTTTAQMWDLNRHSPALIQPGDTVQFVEATNV